MATYRLKRKTYGIGDIAATAVGSTMGAAGGMADTTTGGIVGGIAAASSPLADIVPGGEITAGLIGYAGTRAAGKVAKATGRAVRGAFDD
jgi:hypothetical protein